MGVLRELRDWMEELACRAGVDTWPPAARIAAAAVAVALVGAALARWGMGAGQPAASGEVPVVPEAASATVGDGGAAPVPAPPATLTVHVVGAVRRPGVYRLPAGARAADAVDAAGGLLGDADQAAVNLAAVLEDGQQVAVPLRGEAGASAAPGGGPGGARLSGGGAAGGLVDLNTADVTQLDALPGVGPATAAKIVADREANGRFRSVDDLMRVPGIGAKKLDGLRDAVCVR